MHASIVCKSILLVATVSVASASKLHGSPGMSFLKSHHQLSRNLMPRQGCTSDQVTCGGGCLVAGSDCCTPGATHWEYCDPGQFCWSFGNDVTACCAPGDVQCGIKCMPPGSACCDNEGDYCDAGEYCFIDTGGSLGCCPQGGESCGSSTTYQAGVTVTGPATASATTPASASTSEPVSTMSSVSVASVESTTPANTAPPIATFTGGAVVTAGPQVAAAVLMLAGQMLL